MISLRSLYKPVTFSSVVCRLPTCSYLLHLLDCSRTFYSGKTTQQRVLKRVLSYHIRPATAFME